MTIRNRTTPLPVQRAWVVVTPPKYSPELDTVVTLWDRLLDFFARPDDVTWMRPSYTRDIQPILQRARRMGAVHAGANGNHAGWPEPMYGFYHRRKIASWLTGDKKMPVMSQPRDLKDGHLTNLQMAALQKWQAGDFDRDWPSTPPPEAKITPDGLDRAALEACVGASFGPGIEAGRHLLKSNMWADPDKRDFRFSSRVQAGDLTARMCIPWHSDFKWCAGDWWPVPRPVDVIPAGAAPPDYQDWDRGVANTKAMVDDWRKLGFVVADRNGRYREVERATRWTVTPELLADGQWTTTVPGPGTATDGQADVRQPAEQLTGVDLASYGRGQLPPGQEHVWPILLTDEDRSIEVTVRAAQPQALSVGVVTPYGPEVADDDPHLTGTVFDDRLELQIALPVEVWPQRFTHAGRWEIRISTPEATTTTAYQLTVATESDIRIGEAAVRRDSACNLTVATDLGEREIQEAVAVLAADGSEVPLQLTGPGGFSGQADTAGAEGSPLRLRVIGDSRCGNPFIRERFLTPGGNG
ncbi:LodA/GoxA family CTQ-dependent oxidase [Kitasatospora atroaurantiaca]|uniref:LodA/GoxA family CTQ-dependent oxidase n=1 Tax=Kitasatospora atroaurantiaca TaxID=285545 RepID=UPI0011A574AA|nr:LodA/GoxA family CTQ-dependent oxidase [Kitasatospora atroaurantiaca]